MTESDKFYELKSKEDVAMLLQTNVRMINIILSKRVKKNLYYIFSIKKKNGALREISSPRGQLLVLQKKLSKILINIYENRNVSNNISYGYRIKRNIRRNAETHLNSQFLMNVDIQDFFGSITYSRVYGLFRVGLKLGEEASKILALLTTFNGILPQGSPCSPVISNMICKRLDRNLYDYARKNNIVITRYADDISISANDFGGFRSVYTISEINQNFNEIFTLNGFQLNETKTHISLKNQRKIVTGLVINTKLNVNRKYIRDLRVKLHKTSMIERDQRQIYFSKLYGKIVFLKHIKGEDDFVYAKYAQQFNNIYEKNYFKINQSYFDTPHEYIRKRMLLVGLDRKHNNEVIENAGNGSAFYVKVLENYYIITCYHVVEKSFSEFCNVKFFQVSEILEEVLKVNSFECVAIGRFSFTDVDAYLIRLDYEPENYFTYNESSIKLNMEVSGAGYSNYNFRNLEDLTFTRAIVINLNQSFLNTTEFVKIIGVDRNFPKGMSGGPVLDSSNNLIGLISNGANDENDISVKKGFIEFSKIAKLIDEWETKKSRNEGGNE